MNCKILVCLFVIALSFALEKADAQNTAASLTGSWSISFLPATPSTTAGANAIEGLVTFTSDGTLVETDASEVAPAVSPVATGGLADSSAAIVVRGPSGTPGHGIWQMGPAAGNYYIQFVTLAVNAGGAVQARKTVTITGSLDANGTTFTGNFTAQSTDRAGTVTSTSSGKVGASKMAHPTLPSAAR